MKGTGPFDINRTGRGRSMIRQGRGSAPVLGGAPRDWDSSLPPQLPQQNNNQQQAGTEPRSNETNERASSVQVTATQMKEVTAAPVSIPPGFGQLSNRTSEKIADVPRFVAPAPKHLSNPRHQQRQQQQQLQIVPQAKGNVARGDQPELAHPPVTTAAAMDAADPSGLVGLSASFSIGQQGLLTTDSVQTKGSSGTSVLSQKRPFPAAIERPAPRPTTTTAMRQHPQSLLHPADASVSTVPDLQSLSTQGSSVSGRGSTMEGSGLIGGTTLLFQQRQHVSAPPFHQSAPSVAGHSAANVTAVSSLNMSSASQQPIHAQQQQPQPQQQQQQQQPSAGSTTTAKVKPNVVPKAELHAWYGMPPRRKLISGDNYHTFHDGGDAHMLRWTSVFVCPTTGELFLSGKYPGAEASPSSRTSSSLLWFAKKVHSEHGAAARALDCLVYRHTKNLADRTGAILEIPRRQAVGLEIPYPEENAVFVLDDGMVPSSISEKIRMQQAEIRQNNGLEALPYSG